ncbi:TetR family transcriptional regulator, partial [Mycobacterium sp. ITM-2017-0098]
MTVEHPLADDYRQRVVEAVHEELARWGIDRFDVGAMANRHGLDVDAIQRRWPDPEELILEALAHWPGADASPPDTGWLRT